MLNSLFLFYTPLNILFYIIVKLHAFRVTYIITIIIYLYMGSCYGNVNIFITSSCTISIKDIFTKNTEVFALEFKKLKKGTEQWLIIHKEMIVNILS